MVLHMKLSIIGSIEGSTGEDLLLNGDVFSGYRKACETTKFIENQGDFVEKLVLCKFSTVSV